MKMEDYLKAETIVKELSQVNCLLDILKPNDSLIIQVSTKQLDSPDCRLDLAGTGTDDFLRFLQFRQRILLQRFEKVGTKELDTEKGPVNKLDNEDSPYLSIF